MIRIFKELLIQIIILGLGYFLFSIEANTIDIYGKYVTVREAFNYSFLLVFLMESIYLEIYKICK